MSKGKIYTMITFFISFCVVIGGWLLTKSLLEQKHAEFLGRNGQIALQSSDATILSADWQEDVADVGFLKTESLSEDMIAKVLAVWENGGNEQPHEPYRGQMNMEQAIEAGKSWIEVMAEHGIVPENLIGCDFDKITARLCTLDAQVDFDQNLLSYWSVQFTENDVVVSLTVHAASGEIWKAKIIMEENESLSDEHSPEELLEIAFSFLDTGNRETVNLINNTTCEIMPKGLVYAAVKERKIAVDEQEAIIEIDLWLSVV